MFKKVWLRLICCGSFFASSWACVIVESSKLVSFSPPTVKAECIYPCKSETSNGKPVQFFWTSGCMEPPNDTSYLYRSSGTLSCASLTCNNPSGQNPVDLPPGHYNVCAYIDINSSGGFDKGDYFSTADFTISDTYFESDFSSYSQLIVWSEK